MESLRVEQAEFDRVLATVMFTDIVDSTALTASLGDARWQDIPRGTTRSFEPSPAVSLIS